ncbi:MAG TPA: hypothetical protein VMH86_01485 [Rhizomicrobium sp.]|nr:hypothetical protein [Rhizomicrobium sp.]
MGDFLIKPISEADILSVVEAAGGRRAYADATRQKTPNADFILGNAVVELKLFEEEGLAKPERQQKLAALFREYEPARPVIVLDRSRLPPEGQRKYDRILEGPVKAAVASSRDQLLRSRSEFPEAQASILMLVNNGYTALDHKELLRIVAHRVRNDTRNIDGVVVAGCYFYSDSFDHFFLLPMEYVPINIERAFRGFDELHRAWSGFANKLMSGLIIGELDVEAQKGPVVDLQFDVDGKTFVKPVPPMGMPSQFYVRGRPRRNQAGFGDVPAVALTFPEITRTDWPKFRKILRDDYELPETYEDWLKHRSEALAAGASTRPLVLMPVAVDSWLAWCKKNKARKCLHTLRVYANELFGDAVRARLSNVRELRDTSIVPARYVASITEIIGQDCGNDVSHIYDVRERPGRPPTIRPLVENVRLFSEHAISLACAYAVAEGVECVMSQKNLRYAWE